MDNHKTADARHLSPWNLLNLADFRRIWMVGGVGWIMRWFEMLAIGVYIFKLTGSPLIVALVTVVRFLPIMLLSAIIGAIAERYDRRLMLLSGAGLLALSAVVLGILSLSGKLAIWHVAIGSFISGMYFTMDFPVRRTMLGEIAGLDGIATAMSLDTATNHIMRMLGPAFGGLVLEIVGLYGVYFVGGFLYLIAFSMILRINHTVEKRLSSRITIISQIQESLSYIRGHPRIMAALIVTMTANIFGFPFVVMIPVIGHEILDLDGFWTGTLQSAEGFGALVGALFIANMIRPGDYFKLYVGGTALFLMGVIAFSFASVFEFSLVFLFCTGLGVAGFSAMQSTIIFLLAPPNMRSRLMGVLAVCIGFGPVGMLHVGLLADHFGASFAIRVSALEGLMVLLMVTIFLSRLPTENKTV